MTQALRKFSSCNNLDGCVSFNHRAHNHAISQKNGEITVPTVAELLIDQLADAGVELIFGLPGGEVVEILDAIRRKGMQFVLTHNEASAVFMADAAARMTGKPAVSISTLGPGATNAITGVAHAHLDRSPVIHITAQKPDDLLPDYTHQVLDLHALYRPITKGTFQLTADNAAATIAHAIALTAEGRPGPIHLQISNEEAGQLVAETTSEASAPQPTDHLPSATAIDQARTILGQARRPIILVGVGLEPEGPYEALQALAEAANAPVIVTPKVKGALSDRHELAAGTIGLTRADAVYTMLAEADAIIAVGFDVVELVKPWQHDAPLIWIAPWANQDPVLPAAVELVGPMAPVLQQLSDSSFVTADDWGHQRVAAHRQSLASRPQPTPAPGRLSPQLLLQSLRRLLPDETLLAVDVGSHKIFSSLEWPTYHPNRFSLSNGLSSMGFALPSAIGSSLALGGAPTVALTGDAGMAMVLGELGVLAELQLPVIVVVLNDGAIDLIRSHQVRSGKPVYGTEFTSPNFSQIATAYGLASSRVDGQAGLEAAIAAALATNGPAVIEVMLDPTGYPTTPVYE